MSHYSGDVFPVEMLAGTIVLIARRDSARKYYIHARMGWLELNQQQTVVYIA